MSKNKLTHTIEGGSVNDIIRITGSLRQPTLVEAQNYILDNGLYDFEGLKIAAVNGEEYIPPEDSRSLVLYTYGYGAGCPVCGKMQNLELDHCPVCLKKWED